MYLLSVQMRLLNSNNKVLSFMVQDFHSCDFQKKARSNNDKLPHLSSLSDM